MELGIGGQRRTEERLRLVRALFPDAARDFDRALDEHGGGDAGAAFDAWLDVRASELIPGAGFAEVDDVETAERFQRAFSAARRAAAWFGEPALVVPEPEAFSEAGVDFAALSRAMSADASLVPVPAPYGLGADPWRAAYRAAADDRAGTRSSDATGFSEGPLEPAAGPDHSPLVFASEAVRGFEQLDAVPVASGRSLPVAASTAGKAPGSASDQGRRARWTLRLVPAGQKPQTLGLGFAHGEHASLPEMLMLQLMNLADGRELVDAASFTWLAGPLAEGRMAARHVYDAGERVVRITCREVGSQGPHMGSRPPIG